jgi:hypothetical protein
MMITPAEWSPSSLTGAVKSQVARAFVVAFVLEAPPADIEPLAATLTRLWVNALCLRTAEVSALRTCPPTPRAWN